MEEIQSVTRVSKDHQRTDAQRAGEASIVSGYGVDQRSKERGEEA
jgi:hypothetical protein